MTASVAAPALAPVSLGTRLGGVGWVFLAPAMVGFVLFYVIPTIRGLYFSLTDSNLLKPAKVIGLKNYQDILNDKLFWNSLNLTPKLRERLYASQKVSDFFELNFPREKFDRASK